MDSFELNKIAGAVLATGLLVMALSITSEIIYEPEDLRENGYVIAVDETVDTDAAAGAIEEPPIEARLQTADASAGEAAAKKCQACHTFHEGEPAKVGPNLYGIVTAPAAHMPGFKYSGAMQEMNDAGMVWSYEELDRFLENPKAEVPGTLMAFAGLKKPDERADVIAYLRTLHDNPPPLPEPPAAEAPEEAAAAPEGEAPAAMEGAESSDGMAAPESSTTTESSATSGESMPASEAPPASSDTSGTMEASEPPAVPAEETAPEASGEAPPLVPESMPPAGETAQ